MIRHLALPLVLAFGLLAQPAADKTEKLAPYYPTPATVVERMLRLGKLHSGEKMFDLGSGDGRIVVMAAERFKADATGVEFDEDLYKQSTERIKKKGLTERARIILGDIMEQDYSAANLVTVYL
ncbi:MAG: methyltransferase domain-containing protein, partial [bacterium]|nr:methyltransferase domain-containing protein [bacterium]